MYLLYSFLLAVWSILLLPLFVVRAWRRSSGLEGFAERLGCLPEGLRSDGRATVWFHSCSVGETLSLQPLVKALHGRFPGARFVFSTTTPTGHAVAAERFAEYGRRNTFFFPVDLGFVVGRVLDRIRPAMVVIVDTEIWPNLLRLADRRGIPVVLVNGRISRASFRYYRRLRPFLKHVLRHYRALMMQSPEDAARIRAMGAPDATTTTTGNIKFDGDIVEGGENAALARALESLLGPPEAEAPLIVAGSTHPNEEQALLEALGHLRNTPGLERTRLLLAPRHPERFEAVAQLIDRRGFAFGRRSQAVAAPGAPVILLDTIGELAAAYRFATVVFVGGTLVRHGGHSIMEPALYSKAIVVGPSMENFQPALREFLAHGGIRQVTAGCEDRGRQMDQLQEAFRFLLGNPAKREAMGRAAYSVLDRNRGAVSRTALGVAAILEESRTKNAAAPAAGADGE